MVNNRILKSQLRQKARENRNRYLPSECQQAGEQLIKNLLSHEILTEHRSIACFMSFDREISTQPIIKHILEQNKVCYLPKLRPNKPNRLWFMPYDLSSKMSKNRFGISEVELSVNHALAISKLDLVLLPLVAFDQNGTRLGMGGGYYDATFSHLRNSCTWPRFIGLAFESQKLSNLPSDPWDLPLDGVCTEQRYHQFV